MKVTGYKLQQAIRACNLQIEVLNSQRQQSVFAFEGESREDVPQIQERLEQEENRLVKLQELQAQYNLVNKVNYEGKNVSLLYLVKGLGAVARAEKFFRSVMSAGAEHTSWDRYDLRRNADEQVASKTITDQDAMKLCTRYGARSAKIRELIQVANSRECELQVEDGLL